MKLNKVLCSFIFAAVADFVLWDDSVVHGYGWLIAFLYLVAVALIVYHNRFVFRRGVGLITLIVSGVTYLALLENVSILSVGLACFNLLVLSFIRLKDLDAGRLVVKIFYSLKKMLNFPYIGIVRRNSNINNKLSFLEKCIIPCLFSLGFIVLFSFINPIFVTILRYLYDFIVEWMNPLRIALFLVMASVGFVLIRNRAKNWKSIFDFKNTNSPSNEFFSYRSICISLISFNIIFYAHIISEIYSIYFSESGTVIVSVASQAVDAAHVLLIATLLAIAFILLTSAYDKKTSKTSLMQFLTIMWLVQNFIIMLLGIKYLGIYVASYGLTYWRFSSIIWFGLVAFGLVLTGIKIFCKKNINWLVNCNAISVYVTLLACCFINVPSFIAEFNILLKPSAYKEYNYTNYTYDRSYRRGITVRGASVEGCNYLHQEYGEDAIPAFIKANRCIALADNEIKRFEELYNNSYRFWTYRRYLIAKAIENYRMLYGN